MTPTLAELLASRHETLVRYCLRHAGRLLRFETAEDLAQGVQLAALKRERRFELRSEGEFEAWLFTLARGYLTDRLRYWSRLKRHSGVLLRITSADPGATADPRAVSEPVLDRTGPSTFAARREQVVLAMKALSFLGPRDQQLVTAYRDGLTINEIAEQLSIAYDAARIAQGRALERFRKSFALLTR